MNRLKHFFFPALISLFFLACSDPCKDVDCNNGNCDEGICICEDGYGGDSCDTRLSEQFAGEWQGPFDCVELVEDVVLNIQDDEVDIRKIIMNSVGLTLSFNGISFTLDETTLRGNLNQSYTGFSIDTQTMIIEIPGNPGISADVFGSGFLVDSSTLSVLLNVKNEDFGAFFSCTGSVKK